MLAVASHPIQYQAPWFRALAQVPTIDFSVLFIQQPDAREQGRGFGVEFQWDVPVLEGYSWRLAPGIRRLNRFGGFFSASIGSPRALLRELAPDVILLTGWHMWPLVQVLMVAWWARIPVVMRGESNALRARPWYVRALHRLLLDRCAAFLPIGRSNRDFYARYGYADVQLFDAPYFVDNARFSAAATESSSRRQQLREQWAIPLQSVCFCYAGKLEPKKHILDLLGALRIAVASGAPQMHLLVVGTGELLPQAKAMASQFALPVTFAGFLNQTEIPSAYVAIDCLVLPSDHGETWGLVVNEAMACGRPAIVSDRVGCAQDLVTEGVTGSIFPFGDVQALAGRLVAMADVERLAAMGQRARTRVFESYSVDKSVEGTVGAVRHALAQHA